MTQHNDVKIYAIPADVLPQAWQIIGVPLAIGAASASEQETQKMIDRIKTDHAQVWGIFDDRQILGAFVTSVVIPDAEPDITALDVYGLGGIGAWRWSQKMCEILVEYGTANGCRKITFKGRKALKRLYSKIGNIVSVGTDENGQFLYERAL